MTMKRFLAPALLLGAVSGFGLVGCGEESKVEHKETVSTPFCTDTRTVTEKVKTTGDASKDHPDTTTPAK